MILILLRFFRPRSCSASATSSLSLSKKIFNFLLFGGFIFEFILDKKKICGVILLCSNIRKGIYKIFQTKTKLKIDGSVKSPNLKYKWSYKMVGTSGLEPLTSTVSR